MSIAFEREPRTPEAGRWYFLRSDDIPTGQVMIQWVNDRRFEPHGRIEMSPVTGRYVGSEDMRAIAAAQRQARETGHPVMVMVYDHTPGMDPIRQTITMMRDTLTGIGKNNGRIDPLAFTACSQAMATLRSLMQEADELYSLLAQAYVENMDGDLS